MKLPAIVAAALIVLSLAHDAPARGDHDERRAVEAGPEDGFLCCNGLTPFLVHGNEVLVTTGRAGIFRSESRGERWQRSMEGMVAPNGVSGLVGHVCQAPSEPRIVYALAGAELGLVPFDGLFYSEDFGRTWIRRAPVPTNFAFAECTVDADDPRTLYVSGSSQTWKSTDGGQTVEIFPVPACAAGGAVLPRPGILYVSRGHGCRYVSTNGGVTFAALAEPPAFRTTGFNVSPDGRAIFISTRDASFRPTGTFRSTDGGASYVPLLPASDDPRFLRGVEQVNVDGRGSVYLSTLGGPFRTDDGGRTFRSLLNGFRASAVNDLAFDASWLNQIEIYFSIVQRKALTPNDFSSLKALQERLLAFEEHYQQIASPFQWRFTRHDLHTLMRRISTRAKAVA